MSDSDGYTSKSINTLGDIEGIRKRPSMYIDSTSDRGLHHLVYEVVDNSIDEAMEGFCSRITITLHDDGSVSVADDGRGIPVEPHGDTGRPTVEVVATELHAGGKFDNDSYNISGGLHGVGITAVNALSETFQVRVLRDGTIHEQRFAKGIPQSELETADDIGLPTADATSGTVVKFTPDSGIFETARFDAEVLADRCRELAFLNPGIEISLTDERSDAGIEDTTAFQYDGGISEYVAYLNDTREALHDDAIHFIKKGEPDDPALDAPIVVEVALQATEEPQPSIHTFTNNIRNRDGGTHLTGFKTALTRVVNSYAEENNLLSDLNDTLAGGDVRDGLTAVLTVRHPDPQFKGQTKTKLANQDARSVVESAIHESLSNHLNENPGVAERIVKQSVQAAKARKAAEQAKKVTRRKSPLDSTRLPGKLADCQSQDPNEAELFVVEGDSAGGSAKQAREPASQAVLPLSGKILNVEKHRLDRVLENDEIKSLVQGIGAGVGDDFDPEETRYNTVIIATDADVDGAHIRTLLLTLLYRYMRPLVEEGYVYATKPPLYRIRHRGETYDVMTEEERDRVIEQKCDGSPSQVQRFKGLGEMNPEQLWETTMNPDNRTLKKITVEDAAAADKMFSVLMGDAVEPRKEFIREHSPEANWVDI